MTAQDVDYSYYKNEYGGKLEAGDFHRLRGRAFAWLDGMTMGRIRRKLGRVVNDRAMMALCAVVDTLDVNINGGGGVVSETNDGISVTYARGSEVRSDEQRLYSAAAVYLAPTGLIDRRMGHACL